MIKTQTAIIKNRLNVIKNNVIIKQQKKYFNCSQKLEGTSTVTIKNESKTTFKRVVKIKIK